MIFVGSVEEDEGDEDEEVRDGVGAEVKGEDGEVERKRIENCRFGYQLEEIRKGRYLNLSTVVN